MAKKNKIQNILINDDILDLKDGLSEKNFDRLDREISIELKKLDLTEQQLVLKEKQLNIEEIKRRQMKNEEKQTAIELIDSLQNLMTAHIVDADRTVMGSEPVLIPVYDEIERGLIKKKIFDILKEF
jgi:hypothetical protein